MTNKKNLLEEARVKRWMKLAKLDSLTESFAKENFSASSKPLEEEEVDEVLTKNQSRATGSPDRLNEMDDETPDQEAPSMDMGSDMGSGDDMPPTDAGDDAGLEGDVETFLSQVADSLTSFTGVPVDVSSDSESPEAPEVGDAGSAEPSDMEPMEEPAGEEEPEEEVMQEEKSPVGAKTTSSSMNNPPAPKKTMQADQGKIKDPMKSDVRVKGAEKPTQMSGQKDHKYTALEERLVRNVLKRLVQEIKRAKEKKNKKGSK